MFARPHDRTALGDAVWRSIAEGTSDAVLLTDEALAIRWANRAACALLECSSESLQGHALAEFVTDGAPVTHAMLTAPPCRHRFSLRTTNQTRRTVELAAQPVGEGLLACIVRDVTVQADALQSLSQSEESFRALIEQSPDATIIHTDGMITYVNGAAVRLLGYETPEDLIGLAPLDLISDDDRPRVAARLAALLAGKQSVPFSEEQLIRQDGTLVLASIAALNIVFKGRASIAALARDITQQRMLESRLFRNERMAAVGTLASGVAHEINNPLGYLMLRLGAIESVAEQLQETITQMRDQVGSVDGPRLSIDDLPPGDLFEQLADHVQTAMEGAERVRSIVNDLRLFARADESNAFIELDIHGPLERALSLGGHEIKHRARIDMKLDRTIAPVLASEGRLMQLFLNLLLNASGSLPEEASDGVVTIETFMRDGAVGISFRDTGDGIEPEKLHRVFQPLALSKPDGRGTGLALAICQNIVQSLDGKISVESALGEGTVVTVLLPAAEFPPE